MKQNTSSEMQLSTVNNELLGLQLVAQLVYSVLIAQDNVEMLWLVLLGGLLLV